MEGKANGFAGAGAGTPTPVAVLEAPLSKEQPKYSAPDTAAVVLAQNNDIARFMPVMAIEQALQRRAAIVDATKRLMQEGVDYGKIPGSDRPCLLQPGADKLCNLFGLVIQYEVVKSEEDWTGEKHGGTPFFFYEVRGRAYRGDYLMGEGVGSCSSWESKYRWRKAERTCPQCSKPNIRKSREGGWYCWVKTEGCGATFRDGDPAIEKQETGRKANPDMADCVNTILKMAFKRCKVSTTINATSASEFFTQDVEEQGAPPADHDPRGYNVDTGGAAYGTPQAQQNVADRKLAELKTKGDARRALLEIREKVGEFRFLSIIEKYGTNSIDKLLQKPEDARKCYRDLLTAEKEVA